MERNLLLYRSMSRSGYILLPHLNRTRAKMQPENITASINEDTIMSVKQLISRW